MTPSYDVGDVARSPMMGYRQAEDDEDPLFGTEWHCNDCSLGDRTQWDPSEGCPRYPCRAFIPPGWVL